MRFKDKVAIVTGSGRGIGRTTAVAFAKEGARVVINDIDKEPAEETLNTIKETGGEAIICLGGTDDRQAVQNMVDTTLEKYGTIDILVNNAGIIRPAMINKMDIETWNKVIAVNLTGVFNCLQAVGNVFLKKAKENPTARCNGKIVNVSSVAGLRGTMGQINYGAAKAGVIGITMSAAREWGRWAINVNAVAFGMVATRMTETVRTDPRFADQYKSQIILGRYAEPEDVAPAILFLCSADADYITGQTLSVCGGFHIAV
jgi:3-oxoacyl-[acyl-carrier protein] reductase